MQEQPTTAPRALDQSRADDEVDEAANLVDVLFGLVTVRRQLSYDERQELRQRVSDRLLEIVPYVEDREETLDRHIDRIAHEATRLRTTPNNTPLSELQCDVLALILQGKSDRDIAEILHVTHMTVSKCSRTVVHKLGAVNRVHAAARLFAAVAESLVEESPCEPVEHKRQATTAGRQALGSDVTGAPDLPLRPQAESGASA
jgi:DNA-binding CsgD family transcriptional regulator